MSLQFTAYTVPLLLSGLMTTVVAALVWRERPKSGATWLSLSVVSVSLWSFGQAMLLSTRPLGLKLLGYNVTLAGFVLIAPAFLLFALAYTGHGDVITRRVLALLSVVPVLALGLAATNPGELVYVNPRTVVESGQATFAVEFGVGMWLIFAYSYAQLFAGDWLLVKKFLRSRNVYRKRTFFILAYALTLRASHVASFTGVSPLPHDTLGPLLNLVLASLALLVFAGYRSLEFLPLKRLLAPFSAHSRNLSPVARNRAIEELSSGFLVVDHQNRIVDVNPEAKQLLTRGDERIVGKSLTTMIPREAYVRDDTEFLDPGVEGEYTGVWAETPDGERRCFDFRITALTADDGEPAGRISLIDDVTERERRKRKLERRNEELNRQNEQLEEFASIVSHDLRNPLNVAKARLTLIDGNGENEHVAEAADAIDRMEEIIDEVLTMAKLGQTVSETASVELAGVAREAWTNVETGNASLTVAGNETIEADRRRLLRVFENLFRNAVEHGGPDVTVTVGLVDGGFYVADDGSGLPEDCGAEVFEQGMTTNESGTGFGLAIVDTIAEAHGWDVTATENEAGGARFEITGTTTVPTEEPGTGSGGS